MTTLNAMETELLLARKLFWLMSNDHIFFTSYNEDKKDWDDGVYPVINCNDTFVPGADAESLAEEDIDAYMEVVGKWPRAGSYAWCGIKRAAKPWRAFNSGEWKEEFDEATKNIPSIIEKHTKGKQNAQ